MNAPVTTMRRHKCARIHREYRTLIACAIGARRLLWMQGDGRYAVISWCGGWNEVTVTLHLNAADALATLKQINRTWCGRRCTGNHQMVEVTL